LGGTKIDMRTPDKTFIGSETALALTTLTFPFVTGYGTVLFQVVDLGAWGIVARLTSGQFADLHHNAVWSVALVLNLAAFSLIAIPVWALFRSRAPRVSSIAVIVWCALYVALLFVLVPATDGP
jgi:hypothetical protein